MLSFFDDRFRFTVEILRPGESFCLSDGQCGRLSKPPYPSMEQTVDNEDPSAPYTVWFNGTPRYIDATTEIFAINPAQLRRWKSRKAAQKMRK